MVLTGTGRLYLTASFILKSWGMLNTPPHVFFGLGSVCEGVDSHNLLDVIFANFTDLKSVPANFGVVKPDNISSSFEC
jgi:hypothetical protein